MMEPTRWSDLLRQWVPGYAGYADRQHRRACETAYRQYLADQVSALQPPLDRVIRALADQGKVIEVLPLERTRQRLADIEQKIRTTDYASSAFFEGTVLEETALDRLYQYDLVLIEQVRDLHRQIEQFERGHPSQEDLVAGETLEAAAVALSAEFEQRTDLIRTWTWSE
ncbi:MAG TPA: hypothetical protein VNM72_02340 [Blastocatellia bacterium]|nr:hypothetical protein [Blastocatellia bacterium]